MSDMRIGREEIFGPVLSIMPYKEGDCQRLGARSSLQIRSGHGGSTRVSLPDRLFNYPAWDERPRLVLQAIG